MGKINLPKEPTKVRIIYPKGGTSENSAGPSGKSRT